MPCPSCKYDNPSAARFCGACGNQLTSPVTPSPEPSPSQSRGTNRPPVILPAAFVPDIPGNLAEKIVSGRAALAGERRQVTVLFGDIANFTGLSEKLDPEEVHRIVQRCFELVGAEIHRF